ncbi:MAG: ABC-F family ATP-binding cassette domain-containing protein [Lachnospiraceae bacterium]|nr:ABC-F family ATP-binding cassette domain-containing protein [Lachnospiraceae bacterium]
MLIDIQNITKSYPAGIVLGSVSFHIEAGQKCALIGTNGSGKTTLLKIMVSETAPDSGQIVAAAGCSIGYLPQVHEISSSMSLYEYIKDARKDVFDLEKRLRQTEALMKNAEGEELEKLMKSYSSLSHEFEQKNGFAAESEIRGVLKGLGFENAESGRIVSELSGGEKTRAALGRLLLSEHDLLLLDEPTNHLDLKAVEWLESFLSSYRGALLIVSHDRYFLDKTVSKVFEIENHHLISYDGNYSVFSEKKARVRADQLKAYLNQQKEIARQEEVIAKLRSFNREKSIKRAESRVKALERIERLEKPVELKSDMSLKLTPAVLSGNDVLSIDSISKSYGSAKLFSDLSIELKRSEKVALIGANGTGKTTILKIINGLTEPDQGRVAFGANVFFSYYDQEQQLLDPDKTIFEQISDEHPDMSNTEIRNLCAGFLFTGDAVFKKTEMLSGGEKVRLSLARLMLSKANFLILDEPTNHLDIVSREILETAIRNYTGTVFYVSHDRYFINRTATRILELENGILTEYKGNYDYYIEKKSERMSAASADTPESEACPSEKPASGEWQDYKKEQARLRKQAADLRKTEDRIQAIEERIAAIDEETSLPENARNASLLADRYQERSGLSEELEKLYVQWETLAEAST